MFFILFKLSLGWTFAGMAELGNKANMLIILTFLIVNAFSLFLYTIFAQKKFLVKEAVFFVVGFLLIPILFFSFIFSNKYKEIAVISTVVLLISLFIVFASQLMVRNKDFVLLTDDYIMGAMWLITIFPLISQLDLDNNNKF